MDFNILSFGEEQKLSNKGLINYYSRLRDYLKNTDHEGLSKSSLTICPYINPLVRKVLNNYCGYDIETRYDSDINGLDGITVMKKLGEIRNFNTKVILLTRNNNYEYNDDYLKYGFADYILKPLTKEKILEKIGKLL